MRFEWNSDKSEACYVERGFDIAYAASAFFDPDRLIEIDNRIAYGEDRYRLIGCIEQRLFVLIYTPRQSAIRIISARKANHRETRHYEDRKQND